MPSSREDQLLTGLAIVAGAAAGLLVGRQRRAQARGAALFDMDPRLLEGKHFVSAFL